MKNSRQKTNGIADGASGSAIRLPRTETGQINLIAGGGNFTQPIRTLSVDDALEEIQGGMHEQQVENVRYTKQTENPDAYHDAKKLLPAFTWSGTFSYRSLANLTDLSGYLILDIDPISGDNLSDLKRNIDSDPHTFASFWSPGFGIKILVRTAGIIPDPEMQRDNMLEDLKRQQHEIFGQISDYYAEKYGIAQTKKSGRTFIDPSGKDIPRLCYVCFDPDLYHNPDAEPFVLTRNDKQPVNDNDPLGILDIPGFEEGFENPMGAVKDKEYYSERAVNIAVNMIEQSVDGEKHDILRNAATLLGGYVAGGIMSEHTASLALRNAIEAKPNVRDINQAFKTIQDGLNNGAKQPILYDDLEQERQAYIASLPARATKNPDEIVKDLASIKSKPELLKRENIQKLADLQTSDYGRYLEIVEPLHAKSDSEKAISAFLKEKEKAARQKDFEARQKIAKASGKPQIFLNLTEDNTYDMIVDKATSVVNDVENLFYRKNDINVYLDGKIFETLSGDKVLFHLNRRVMWFRQNKDGEISVSKPMKELADMVLASDDLNLPKVRCVYQSPVIHRGRILKKGYDARSKSLVLNDAEIMPMTVTEAKKHLEFVICDFPFADDTDKTNTIGCLIAPFLSGYFLSVPMIGIDAPANRSGKTLLAQVCETAYLNEHPNTQTYERDEAELRKVFTTCASEGDTAIIFDNGHGYVDNAVLAKAATSNWKDRLLNVNKSIISDVRPRIYLTGTNLSYSNEIAHRLVQIRLYPNTPNPGQRTGFKVKGGNDGLLDFCVKNRDKTVSAVFAIITDWEKNGRVMYRDEIKGGFDSYVGTVGGILKNAGYDGYLKNAGQIDNAETNEDLEIVKYWWERFGTDIVKTTVLFDGLKKDEDFIIPAKTERGEITKFGIRLKNMKGRWISLNKEICVKIEGVSGKGSQYKLFLKE